MIRTKEVLVIHHAWMLAFLLCYVLAAYIFFKTDSIFIAGLTLGLSMVFVAFVVHAYYGVL